MWADSLQSLELAHLQRILIWGGVSLVGGAIVLLLLLPRRIDAPLASHFAIQCASWGAINLAIGALASRNVPLRDYEAASSLARTLWIWIGLEAGGMVIGLTLLIGGWLLGRRLGLMGAGLGVAIQSATLLVLDLIFVRGIHL